MKFFQFIVLVAFCSVTATLIACDACGCSVCKPVIFSGIDDKAEPAALDSKDIVVKKRAAISPSFFVGEQIQYSRFGSLRDNNARVPNIFNQHEDSLITQTFVGCQLSNWSSVQINVPYIERAFRRPSAAGIDDGSVSGLGDVSLIADFIPYSHEEKNWGIDCTLGGGVKFPTGDPHRIAEELGEEDENSGIHGHDLALGSGSFDGIFIAGLDFHCDHFFYTTHFEYILRSTGYIGYRYADEIVWSTGPGCRFSIDDDLTIAFQCRFSGSSKGNDTFQGEKATDTAMTDLYVGPEIAIAWLQNIDANIGVDIPVIQDETLLQAVPDYRIRGSVTWRF